MYNHFALNFIKLYCILEIKKFWQISVFRSVCRPSSVAVGTSQRHPNSLKIPHPRGLLRCSQNPERQNAELDLARRRTNGVPLQGTDLP